MFFEKRCSSASGDGGFEATRRHIFLCAETNWKSSPNLCVEDRVKTYLMKFSWPRSAITEGVLQGLGNYNKG